MSLPELALQSVYARLAWGLVFAALLVAVMARRDSTSGWKEGIATALALALMWLPGQASPAYWLGLAFQYPSVMLLALCTLSLSQRLWPARVSARSAPGLAIVLALGGALLYVDSVGWLNLNLYALGFDARVAASAVLLLGAAALWALRRESTRSTGIALLACVVGFALARLPSGNLFDALLDPLLWCWAVWMALSALRRRLAGAQGRASLPAA